MVCWVAVAEAEARAARHDWELVAVVVEPGAEAAERALEGESSVGLSECFGWRLALVLSRPNGSGSLGTKC